jgi:hypothetical protein
MRQYSGLGPRLVVRVLALVVLVAGGSGWVATSGRSRITRFRMPGKDSAVRRSRHEGSVPGGQRRSSEQGSKLGAQVIDRVFRSSRLLGKIWGKGGHEKTRAVQSTIGELGVKGMGSGFHAVANRSRKMLQASRNSVEILHKSVAFKCKRKTTSHDNGESVEIRLQCNQIMCSTDRTRKQFREFSSNVAFLNQNPIGHSNENLQGLPRLKSAITWDDILDLRDEENGIEGVSRCIKYAGKVRTGNKEQRPEFASQFLINSIFSTC